MSRSVLFQKGHTQKIKIQKMPIQFFLQDIDYLFTKKKPFKLNDFIELLPKLLTCKISSQNSQMSNIFTNICF